MAADMVIARGGTWYLGGYICSIWGLADPPIHLPKLSAQTHPSTIFFVNFCSWTHLSTKIWRSNPSIYHFLPIFAFEPIYLPKFYAQNPSIYQIFTLFFWKMTHPSILHQPFKTHPTTSSIRIHENMWVPPPGIILDNNKTLITFVLEWDKLPNGKSSSSSPSDEKSESYTTTANSIHRALLGSSRIRLFSCRGSAALSFRELLPVAGGVADVSGIHVVFRRRRSGDDVAIIEASIAVAGEEEVTTVDDGLSFANVSGSRGRYISPKPSS